MISSIAIASILLPSYAQAESENIDRELAEQIVNDYRVLRTQCADAQGTDRRSCFSELSATTKTYKISKDYLAQQQSQTTDIADALTGWNISN